MPLTMDIIYIYSCYEVRNCAMQGLLGCQSLQGNMR